MRTIEQTYKFNLYLHKNKGVGGINVYTETTTMNSIQTFKGKIKVNVVLVQCIQRIELYGYVYEGVYRSRRGSSSSMCSMR